MKSLKQRVPILHGDISNFTTPTNKVIQHLRQGDKKRGLVRGLAHAEAPRAAQLDGRCGRHRGGPWAKDAGKVIRAVVGDGFEVPYWEAGVEYVECRVAEMEYEGLGLATVKRTDDKRK